MGRRFERSMVAAFAALCFALPAPAHAQQSDDAAERARTAFKEGAAFVEQTEWSRALAAFEQSRAAREHALTIYNIGVCQRFIGRYTLARETLTSALARNDETHEMPVLFAEQAKTYLSEIDQKLARVRVKVTPPTTAIAVDGRPLVPLKEKEKEGDGAWVAGVAPGGAGKSVGAERFDVLVDPTSAVFTFTLEGHDTIEIRRDSKPGTATDLAVSMTEQPANVDVASNRAHAVVRVNDVDVGLAPVQVSRPPGTYRLTVSLPGYVTYESALVLRPGQSLRLDATLPEEKIPVTKRWWFWTAAGVVATSIGFAAYFIARPDPSRPPPDGGTVGWAPVVR